MFGGRKTLCYVAFMADENDTKLGKKRGRPGAEERVVSVRVSSRHDPIFSELGNGDLEAGVQAALELFCAGSHNFFEKSAQQQHELSVAVEQLTAQVRFYEGLRKEWVDDFGAFLHAVSERK